MKNENLVILQFDTRDEVGSPALNVATGCGGVSLMHQFHRASQLADELFIAELKECKITPRQFVVLAQLLMVAGALGFVLRRVTGAGH